MISFRSPAGATMIGLFAPIMWGASVSLVRGIAENFGIAQGQCLLYLVAAISLFFLVGFPKFEKMPKRYKYFGIAVANFSTICFCLSLYFSDGGTQTMEVGMVNYLWPTMTIVCAIVFNGQRARTWIVPGALMSFCGIFWILSNGNPSISDFIEHFKLNPISYILAFFGALSWSVFCSMTRAWSHGQNCSTLIFCIDCMLFAGLWLAGVGGSPEVTLKGTLSVLIGGLTSGLAYAAWTHGTINGNMTVLAIASYFTPVISCVFASFWIGAELTYSFWQGVSFVVLGSLICWHATWDKVQKPLKNDKEQKAH